MSLVIGHISDTHGYGLTKTLESYEGNLLIHTGDLTRNGYLHDTEEAIVDLGRLRLNWDEIIYIPGNHDWLAEKDPVANARLCKENDIVLLNDSGFEFDGVKIWGSPITPWFHDWAFNRHRGHEIRKHWGMIPLDTNILATHGPVKGILDLTTGGDLAGCFDLAERIKALTELKLHLSGHIHEGYGVKKIGNVTYSNGSLLDVRYRFTNKPNIFTYENL